MIELSAELALLAACSLADDAMLAQHAEKAAKAAIDWQRFERMARYHGIAGMVGARLAATAPGFLPMDVEAGCKQALRANAALQAAQEMESIRICDLLEEAGIPSLVLKGVALAHMLYAPYPEWRSSSDIDLLIAEADLDCADALLRSKGYVRTSPAFQPPVRGRDMFLLLQKDFNYTEPHTGHQIELHFRLLSNPHCVPADFEELAAQSRLVETGSGAVRGLDGATFLAYLCWHALGHIDFRLHWIRDLSRMLRHLEASSCAQLAGSSKFARNAIRPAELCDAILAALSGAAVNRRWEGNVRTAILNMEQAKAVSKVRNFGRLAIELKDLRFLLGLCPNWKTKGFFLIHTLSDPRDVAALGLSRRFAPLYALLGPMLSLRRFLARERVAG
jgi:Uncharacterised nucleotidyltransferase